MNASDRSKRANPANPAGDDVEARPSEGLRRATGRDRRAWFALLDAWGAAGRPYREIADWLIGQHDLSNWWAQKLIVEYEQARGLRPPGVRPDGTFEVGASKTVGVPVGRVAAAFMDGELRERWLPGAVMRERASQSKHSLQFDWQDTGSRVVVSISGDKAKSLVVLEHVRIADAGTAQEMKAYWRERLTALKSLLES